MKVDQKSILESYIHYGIEYIKGYIQCLYSNDHISLSETLDLTDYFESQEEKLFTPDLSYIKKFIEVIDKKYKGGEKGEQDTMQLSGKNK